MKKISYTKMREELADVLDALRNGESITVTQRGRPDITIAVAQEPRRYMGKLSSSYINMMNTSSSKRVSFNEAKEKTKKKHAGIIKALEDK